MGAKGLSWLHFIIVRFVLHKFCAELPRQKWHPLHHHLLTLYMNPYGSITKVICNACARSYYGFSYNCHKCIFDLDVNCSLTSDRLTHDGHEHPLILSSATSSGKCSVCDSEGYVFHCADCAFALGFKCATLPVQDINNMSIPLLSNTLLKMTLQNIIVVFVKKNDTQNIGIIIVQIVIILLILIAFLEK